MDADTIQIKWTCYICHKKALTCYICHKKALTCYICHKKAPRHLLPSLEAQANSNQSEIFSDGDYTYWCSGKYTLNIRRRQCRQAAVIVPSKWDAAIFYYLNIQWKSETSTDTVGKYPRERKTRRRVEKGNHPVELIERQNKDFQERMEQHFRDKMRRTDRFLDLYEKDVKND
ncbi:hypothetical protein DPMN_082404 [Dreissena polymorpha]|uniref:Uncharacterized protein n=1 Tax=Dreissena polymorpha TaxID=45954 RepID=A0A9D4BIT5_DREPO|nr:hypothetical protein DPMN_082404 [Dreissena polymorpha]